MLVLTRKSGESVCVGSVMEVKVLAIRGGRVKLGFCGPPEIVVQRTELLDATHRVATPEGRLTTVEAAEVQVLGSATV